MNDIVVRRHEVEPVSTSGSLGVTVLTIRGPRAGPRLALLSGVHGDEWEGVAAIGRVCRILREREIHGEARIVAVCNEPAFAAMQRCSPLDGRDLARCFPGDRRGSATEQVAALLAETVIRDADFLIDLHSAGLHYTMPTLVGYAGGESAAARLSAEAAERFGADAIWRHPPPPPARRSISLAHELSIPWIYAETTGAGQLRERDIACYVQGVQRVMSMLGMVPGEASQAPAPLRLAGSGDLDAATVRAGADGILIRGVEPLQLVDAGDEVGTIVNPLGETVERLPASRRGVVVMLRHTPRVTAGDRVCHLADLDTGP
jgi:predicted deacylase